MAHVVLIQSYDHGDRAIWIYEYIPGTEGLPKGVHGVMNHFAIRKGDHAFLMVDGVFEKNPFFRCDSGQTVEEFSIGLEKALKKKLDSRVEHNIMGTRPQIK